MLELEACLPCETGYRTVDMLDRLVPKLLAECVSRNLELLVSPGLSWRFGNANELLEGVVHGVDRPQQIAEPPMKGSVQLVHSFSQFQHLKGESLEARFDGRDRPLGDGVALALQLGCR